MYRLASIGLLLCLVLPALADSREDKVNKAIKELESGVPKTRAAACEDIGKIAAIRKAYGLPAIDPLLKLLKEDKEEIVRAAACEALAKIDEPKKTVTPLIEVVKEDKAEKVKIAAANGLGLMGND